MWTGCGLWRALTSCCQFAAFLQSTYMAAVMGVLSKDRELALPFINLLEEQLNFHKVCEWRGGVHRNITRILL